MSEYHEPVLLHESIEALGLLPSGYYVDATFGGGGHSSAILNKLGPKGLLFGFDQDPEAKKNTPEDERFVFMPFNFRLLKKALRMEGQTAVDGILADLGVSSHQFNQADRGFSFRFDANLDMRMEKGTGKTAADILASYSAEDLQQLFGVYGEVRNAKTLALAIVQARQSQPIETTTAFLQLLGPLIRGQRNRYLAQVFQALRMEVNDEVGALKDLLQQCLQVLKPGGKLVVISYHSIEDRIVKQFMKTGNVDGEIQQDFYGNISRPFRILAKKAIEPGAEEISRNPRARSARMRIAEKLSTTKK